MIKIENLHDKAFRVSGDSDDLMLFFSIWQVEIWPDYFQCKDELAVEHQRSAIASIKRGVIELSTFDYKTRAALDHAEEMFALYMNPDNQTEVTDEP